VAQNISDDTVQLELERIEAVLDKAGQGIG
jgi:hypothetical protein